VTPLKTRILLADAHALVLRGLRLVLDAEPDLMVVADAGDGAEALKRGLMADVDLAIIDISMPRALAGDLTSFILGRRFGRAFMLRHGPKLGITEPRLEQVERFYAGHGGKAIVVGRFVSLVRPLLPFIAGASNMPARRFILGLRCR
jgi:CheY-like chemotaxis protein